MVVEPLEFGILGPLRALVGGRPVGMAMASQRALLAALLVRANQVVTTGQLIEDLWGPTPPAQAEAAVRMGVSRLRRQLGPAGAAVLVTRRGGYLLQADRELVDAQRFERLILDGQRALAAGQAQVAAELLDTGLGLWRGPVLADVAPMGVVVAERERLEAIRSAALLARVRADEALGHHAEALVAWQALAAERPLDEGVCAGLLRGLCRAGRQVEALEVYRGLRRRLVDELGVEPSPALQELERRILAGDPELQPTLSPTPSEPVRPVVPAELPSDAASFTGRDGELAELERVLVAGGQPGSLVISAIHGAGGIGKSALAIHAAHRLAERFPDGQVYVNLQGATPGLPPLEPGEVLGRLLRSLGVDPTQVPAQTEEAAAARWRSLVAGRRLLVVLDNARDAVQVRPLLPAGAWCAVLVTSRQPLTTLDGAVAVRLDVLSHQEAVQLLGRIAGAGRIAAEPDAAAALARCCGYLPLALRIAGARLVARPGWPISELAGRLADQQRRLDELATGDLAVRACFDVSVQALRDSPDLLDRAAADAFGLLALPDGPDAGVLAAAGLLDVPAARAERVLERLADAQLVEAARPGRYRFHDLLRLYAREHAARQHGEHARVAALTRLLGFYTATAWRTLELLRPGDQRLTSADPRWTRDGLRFTDETAALAWLEAERANLLAAVGQAADLAPAIPAGLAGQLVRALFGFFLVRSYWTDGVWANQTVLELARRTDDRAAQAHTHDDLGSIYWRLERYDEAQASLRESLTISRELGDRRGEASSLSNRGLVSWRLERYEEALSSQWESLTISRELDDRYGQAEALRDLGDVLLAQGDHRQARACWREALEICEELDVPEAEEVRARLAKMPAGAPS
jgi:DNA-binding SARP family transcriptional activator/tetratricopeptide (TPR) repeat protein